MTDNLQYNLGSEWRKWDLHFHTPYSYDYKNKSATNKEIIEKLKENNISVIAITDHHFIDVENIQELQILGKQQNITVFPGIEFCAESRGKEPIHFIGIFSERSNISHIWNEINSKSNIANQKQGGKKDSEIHCKLEKTCSLIRKLGGIVSIHAGSKPNTLENITNSLPVEMAEKKDIVKNIDIFELGKINDQEGYKKTVFPLLKRIIPMIICSDNHKISDYILKENCWIKADPTFEGLKQIIYEPEDRVFIGKEPEILERVRNNKTKYIKSFYISNKKGEMAKRGIWFKDVHFKFNKELIAIIGNKGSGKSAISDAIGLLGDTHNAGDNNKNFTFLNNEGRHKKFRRQGFAEHFEARLEWEDKTSKTKTLDSCINTTQAEKVKYLPQNYFELLTNDLEGEGFEKTLKSVIFLHIPESSRHGKSTFKELEDYKSLSIKKDLSLLQDEIEKLSSEIINLEERKREDYKSKIENLLNEKQKELDEHIKNKPKIKNLSVNKNQKVDKIKDQQLKKIRLLNKNLEKINSEIGKKSFEKNKLVAEKEDLQQIADDLKRFKRQIDDYKIQNRIRFGKYGFNISEIIETKFNQLKIEKMIKAKNKKLDEIKKLFKTMQEIEIEFIVDSGKIIKAKTGSLIVQKIKLEEKINDIKKELSRPEREYQEYKEKLQKWENKKRGIEGDSKSPKEISKTVRFYKFEKEFIENKLPKLLLWKRKKRVKKSLEIFNKKKEIIKLYKEFKKSVDKEIGKDRKFRKKLKIDIEVSFKRNKNFTNNFLTYINKVKRGTFYRKIDGEKYLTKIFEEKVLSNKKNVKQILETIIEYLETDQRNEVEVDKNREISDQIDQIEEFYKFIFSLDYLEPNYELKLDNKTLDELSPGEKGALLLVFYLMIDKEDIPLIIDQPEDNLDNKSVFEVLTHFIKFAKKRRQIIIVTHNPNLAIGADAEQIVHVNLNKKKKYEFTYKTGSIENPEINKKVVDILEGTMPAFDKRRLKYFK